MPELRTPSFGIGLEIRRQVAMLAAQPSNRTLVAMPTDSHDASAVTAPRQSGTAISLLVRRVHLYLGLFLAPWLCMYALSTVVMNHREFVQSRYPTRTPAMLPERELEYTRTFAAGATPQEIGKHILDDLGLTGTHRVSGGKNGQPLIIDRQHAWSPRRITWNAETGQLVIQRQELRSPAWLERMHRRRGYQQPYALEDTWAFSVDLAMAAMVFWSLSGVWLWLELRSARKWGTICGALGGGVFALFLWLL